VVKIEDVVRKIPNPHLATNLGVIIRKFGAIWSKSPNVIPEQGLLTGGIDTMRNLWLSIEPGEI